MKKLLTPIYEHVGGFEIRTKAKNDLENVKHQVMITSWACKFEVGSCIQNGKELFKEWQAKPSDKNP